MPIVGQIQPSYLHPHVKTYINDNTEFQDGAAVHVDDNIKFFYVITSRKGRDNQFITHKDTYEWIREYGNPNINLYGQAGYNAWASLNTGKATVKTMRIMPEDATYSNALIGLQIKEEDDKLTVRHTCSFRDDIQDQGDLMGALENLRNEVPDADGFITLPLAAFYCAGRGAYGDEFRVRLTQTMQMDKENDYKNCKVEVIGTENGLATLGIFEGTIHPDGLDGKRSIFIEDYINDPSTGSNHVNMLLEPSTLKIVTEMYKKLNEDITEETIDVFGFMDKLQKMLPNIEIDADTVALDGIEGIPLSGGSDGAFGDTDPVKRQEAIDAMLIKAFKGEIDRAITSRRRVPSDVILDAGYSAEVKRELLNLAVKRNASALYLDCGKLTTIAEVCDWADDNINLDARLLSKNTQCYKIRDPFSYKPIVVTITYLFASEIVSHFKSKGRHVPFAAANVRLKNHIKGSLLPVIDYEDSDIKEYLYERRVNFFEAISEDVFQRGSQTTAQQIWSDLSEEHNIHELYDIKRIIEDYASNKIYNFAEVSDRTRFTQDAKELFSNRIGITLRSLDVRFEMNAWEEERSILHCYIEIVFKTIAKRVIIEIDVNKRV